MITMSRGARVPPRTALILTKMDASPLFGVTSPNQSLPPRAAHIPRLSCSPASSHQSPSVNDLLSLSHIGTMLPATVIQRNCPLQGALLLPPIWRVPWACHRKELLRIILAGYAKNNTNCFESFEYYMSI